MKSRTKQILGILHVISWVIFFGLCIKTGAIIYSFFVSLVINPIATKNLHLGLDLSALRDFSMMHYVIMVLYIISLSALKAYLFYLAIKIFLKINLLHPFSTKMSFLLNKIGHVAVGIGLLSVLAIAYGKWLTKKGVVLPDTQDYLGGAGEFLMLGAIIYIIAQIFKRGIEIQSENELTV
jgi:hypothetical protein